MAPTLNELIARRLSRRGFLGASAGLAATLLPWADAASAPPRSTLNFRSLRQKIAARDAVAEGHIAKRLLSWGDPIAKTSAAFNPQQQTAGAQASQFGYNNDFIGYFPLPRGSGASDHGLLVINHEFPSPELMFPGWTRPSRTVLHTQIEQAALGMSVIEVKRVGEGWQIVQDGSYARRVTLQTECLLSGPAAGSKRLRTSADPSGRHVLGTVANCSGGITPWHTTLSGEENVNHYFGGTDPASLPESKSFAAMGFSAKARAEWHLHDPRFDLSRTPNESNRFGWVVELDPFDPTSQPVKRTALGRFKHEAATCVVNGDGRVVVYMGDDEADQHVYRFVSKNRLSTDDDARNKSLLDEGRLYVARFDEHSVRWLPLVQGKGPLRRDNGFGSQADVLIDTRLAAKTLGATPMDRPEDIETNPVNGRVYVMLTYNKKRKNADAANPRAPNDHGHVLELAPPMGQDGKPDHAADRFDWSVLLFGGKVASAGKDKSTAWLSGPDNCTFDPKGRLWIATDQNDPDETGIPDGLFACDVDGEGRALLKFFYAVPQGAECCGPCFTPDGTTLFLSVQHPGEGVVDKDGRYSSTYDAPTTRWPDFKEGVPPRPSIVAIRRRDGGPIGA